jgi:integrase/recombinase XerD
VRGFFGEWVLDDRKFFRPDELARLRRHVRGRVERARFEQRVRWIEWFVIELAFETGLRVMEMAALACSDLVLTELRPGVLVRQGKCGKSRYVRIRRSFAQACRDFLTWKEACGESIEDEAPVFLSLASDGHMTTRGLQKAFTRCCTRVGIQGHSIHHARHTFVSYSAEASGHNLPFVQRQAGHSDIRTTQTYLHVLDKSADKAVERLYA